MSAGFVLLTGVAIAADSVVFHGTGGRAVRAELKAGDEIRTTSSSQADVVLGDKILLRLARNSALRVKAVNGTGAEGTTLELLTGRALLQVPSGNRDLGSIQISSARVTWNGTEPLIAVLQQASGKPAMIAVGQGQAQVKTNSTSSDELLVRSGEELEVRGSTQSVPVLMSESHRSDLLRWATETDLTKTLGEDAEVSQKAGSSSEAMDETAEDKEAADEARDVPGARGDSFPRNAEPLSP